MNLHFTGIGGIGMSGLAQWCKVLGHTITGSDIAVSESFPVLKAAGIIPVLEQKEDNVLTSCDVLIYSEAVPQSNPERQEAEKRNIPQYSYFEYLGKLSEKFKTIAVAGTHGKTTITSLFGATAVKSGFDLTVVVGSTVRDFQGSNFHKGNSEYFIVEACEYRENFRFLEPEILVLSNAEYDHPDAYKTKEDYMQAFKRLIKKAKVVICHDEEQTKELLQGFQGEVVYAPKEEIKIPLMGDYNQQNARLCLALANYLNIDVNTFKENLKEFKGVGRRQELLGEKNGVQIYDDYGHHPTEVSACISGFRSQFPEAKIGIIFEPHQFARTKEFLNDFVPALKKADFVGLYPIYAARDTDEDKAAVSIQSLQEKVSGSVVIQAAEGIDQFQKNLHSGDILLFMGAGNISAVSRSWMGL